MGFHPRSEDRSGKFPNLGEIYASSYGEGQTASQLTSQSPIYAADAAFARVQEAADRFTKLADQLAGRRSVGNLDPNTQKPEAPNDGLFDAIEAMARHLDRVASSINDNCDRILSRL